MPAKVTLPATEDATIEDLFLFVNELYLQNQKLALVVEGLQDRIDKIELRTQPPTKGPVKWNS